MTLTSDEFAALQERFANARRLLHEQRQRERLAELEAVASDPSLWDDPERARHVTRELSTVKSDVDHVERLATKVGDLEALRELMAEDDDPEFAREHDALVEDLGREFDQIELRSLYSGEWDEHDAVCEIHSGAGGTDAQDWAEMMLRMYTRWAERRGFEVELDDTSEGQEAGITSATFIVKGRYAYGMLAAEKGVHRLVRISPFDSQARRQTSFASFEAIPMIEEGDAEIQIDEKDLRIDTFRSSGAGGQHVNTTDSAVRITHLPTGLVTSCQNERSQLQNKARAMQIMVAKLAERQREERRAEMAAIAGEQRDVAWGSQIRSYVLHPYQMVKDLRCEFETGNVDAVLDGDLDGFIESFLRWRRTHAAEANR
jgi:peptide chain release factor 2